MITLEHQEQFTESRYWQLTKLTSVPTSLTNSSSDLDHFQAKCELLGRITFSQLQTQSMYNGTQLQQTPCWFLATDFMQTQEETIN